VTRIVQLANFYSETSGGLRVAVNQLGQGYRAAGHDTTLIVPGGRGRMLDGRIEIASPSLPNGSGYRVIVSARAVRRALDAAKPDLIEVHDKLLLRWVAGWARPRHVPVIAISHERLDVTLAHFAPWLPSPVRARVAESVARGVLRRSDRIVVCSRFAAAEFASSPKLRLVALGVDLVTFRPAVVSHPDGGPVRLVCVTRLSAEKLPVLAIDTLAELRRRGVVAELTMVGDGPLQSRLRRHAGSLPVRFTGFVSAGELAALVGRADVALAPGPAETFGLAALEALACGTPIVAVRGSGASELTAGEPSAAIAAPADAVSFADATTGLLALDVGERRSAARRAAERLRWECSVNAMLGIHGELLAQRSQLPFTFGPYRAPGE
jgi:alpha-1,6-mannosyltransferase